MGFEMHGVNPLPVVSVVDSHTAGEPTRCVIAGAPELGSGSMAERLEVFRTKYDSFRRAVLCEPRGSEILVGALILEPTDPKAAAGVIYFNNAGFLGMCGHGTIGVLATLAHLGKIKPGSHKLETPVGVVEATLLNSYRATIYNLPAYRLHAGVTVEVPGYGQVTGDVAWGGNWFFLVKKGSPLPEGGLVLANAKWLTEYSQAIREALTRAAITGAEGAEIDHIEVFSQAHDPQNQSRNFVLCPGMEYDRSPCGTGTSAKLSCLAADGLLKPGEIWRQESILGSVFEGSYQLAAESDSPKGSVLPTITGDAWITGEAELIFDPTDPFRAGVTA